MESDMINNMAVVPAEVATQFLEKLDFDLDKPLDASVGAQILSTIDNIGMKIDLDDEGFSFDSSDLTMDIQERLES